MEITRTITKEGIKAQGGLNIPSPFIFKGNVSGITLAKEGAGWTGFFFLNESETEPIIVEGTLQNSPRGLRANIGGLAENVCTCTENGTVHTIDSVKLLEVIDAQIAEILGCEVSDIA